MSAPFEVTTTIEKKVPSAKTVHKVPRELTMRETQLIAALRQGKRLGITVLDEGAFEGYLTGWDDDTYFFLQPTNTGVDKLLLPKGMILFIQIYDERTFRDEEFYEEMERIVKPFRDAINKEYPRPDHR